MIFVSETAMRKVQPVTPEDVEVGSVSSEKAKVPGRGHRYSPFDDGLDYSVLRVLPADDPHYPGALVPLTDSEGRTFRAASTKDCEKWIATQADLGEVTLAVIQFKQLGSFSVKTVHQATFLKKPRVRVNADE